MPSTLQDVLSQQVREAAPELVSPLERGRLRCHACGHECPIPEGQAGVCKVRFHRDGKLYVPWGYAAGVQCDPIEKKPFFHAWPGALAYSFGMMGCDLHCAYCQNWVTSQALRDSRAISPPRCAVPARMVEEAVALGARVVVSTYNEPLITAEWAVEIFRRARAAGLATGYLSNRNATPRVLEFLHPWVDLYKVDLKSFRDRHYRELGGRLAPVLDTIARLHRMGFWVEIVTLVVPGFNDSAEELAEIAAFIAGVSPDIPWHVTAFHADYRMEAPTTPRAKLVEAVALGRRAGLKFVYAGNLAGDAGEMENTACPVCGERLIERRGYFISAYRLTAEGACPRCHTKIPGRWAEKYTGQMASHPFLP